MDDATNYGRTGAEVFRLLEEMGEGTELRCGGARWTCTKHGHWACRDTPYDAVLACHSIWKASDG